MYTCPPLNSVPVVVAIVFSSTTEPLIEVISKERIKTLNDNDAETIIAVEEE